MAVSFSSRARKIAYDSPSRGSSLDIDDTSSLSSTAVNSVSAWTHSPGRAISPPRRTASPASLSVNSLGSIQEEDEAPAGHECEHCGKTIKAVTRRRRIQAGRIVSYPVEADDSNMSHCIRKIKRGDSIEKFIEALERDGGVIVEDFADVKTVDQANEEVKPWLDQQKNTTGAKVGALAGRTRTVTRLIMRSPTVREQFFADPLYQALAEHFLALTTTTWYGAKSQTNTSHPLLSIAITFDIPPGTPAQGLHRDDKNHHARHSQTSKYAPNRDALLGLFVAGCDTHRANGATRVVPGSHLWGDEQPDFGPDGNTGVVDAELRKGDALIMLGSLYHGGGAYMSALTNAPEDESRTMHAMFCCTGVHRQEEISFLSYPVDEVKGYSRIVQERLGWKQSEPNLGWVDLKSPEFLLG